MTAKLISTCAPLRPRSRKRGWPKMWYFKVANGCSTVDLRSRIASGVARCCNALERLVMEVPGHHALCAQGTARLNRTRSTHLGSTCVVHGTVFPRYLLAFQDLAGRTEKPVLLGLIRECAAVKQLSAALIVHAAIGGNVRNDASGFASFRLFSVGIAGIGDHVQQLPRTAHCRLRGFGHRQQAAIVGGFGRDLLHYDQRMLAIDRSLHVVSGHFDATTGAHE